jgi:transposase-like protein
MSEVDLIHLGFDKHLIKCPHCQKQTVHPWSGTMILFSPAKCAHCGRAFVIALNQPLPGPDTELTSACARPIEHGNLL